MNGMFWLLIGGIAGCLTGVWLGERGSGKVFSTSCTRSLDVLFGVAGAAIGQYICYWAVAGQGTMFSGFGATILGATALVGICRLVSALCFRSPSYRAISQLNFIEWHGKSTVKDLTGWKPRRAEPTKSKSPSA
jgi:uncharacterized membrane protein YeaQ/YmgE (transglycosylase-associated protein family)